MSSTQDRYLGDGVYGSFDGFHVWLTTTSMEGKPVRIALDQTVFRNLLAYAQDVQRNPVDGVPNERSPHRRPLRDGRRTSA
jgi:hypothetical protein